MTDTPDIVERLRYSVTMPKDLMVGDQLAIIMHQKLYDEAADEIERLRELAIQHGAMKESPCKVCGYNGPGFWQPEIHPCAKIYYQLSEQR